MRDKPVVGQKLYSLNVGNMARNGEQKVKEVVVHKVGRKYFECRREGWTRGTKYHLSNWREKTDFCANSCLYVSKQDWLDEKESRELCLFIKDSFEYGHNKAGVTLPAIRTIVNIIKANKP